MDKLLNYFLFQVGWFACVLFGTTQYYVIGPLVVLAILIYHIKSLPYPTSELRLLGFALAIGLIWENLLTVSSLLIYPKGHLLGTFAPLWIVAMWPLLAITLNLSLRWLKGKPLLAAVFGGVGGPMAFLAGERLGAVHIPDPKTAMTALALGWAILFPVLMKISTQYDGYAMRFRTPSGEPA